MLTKDQGAITLQDGALSLAMVTVITINSHFSLEGKKLKEKDLLRKSFLG